MNVASYLRVSSRGQIDGDGFPRQREAIQSFCKTHSLNIQEEFVESVSGTIDGVDRPAFAKLLYTPGVQAIVVERLDRLGRDLLVSEIMIAECRKKGIKVFSADQGILLDVSENGGDPTRVLVRQIFFAISQWEKTMLVRKLKAARERKGCRTGPLPSMTDQEKIMLKFLQESRIMSQYGFAPTKTLQNYADLLNEAGFKTGAGAKWTRQAVHSFLKRAENWKERTNEGFIYTASIENKSIGECNRASEGQIQGGRAVAAG